jgi:hypothetical protein
MCSAAALIAIANNSSSPTAATVFSCRTAAEPTTAKIF